MARFIIITLAAFLLDRLSKMVVMNNMWQGQSIPVWPGIFHLTYIQNPGAAFGMLAGKTWFFVGITLLVLLAMLIGYRWIAKAGRLYQWALGLIAGGAIGNLVDRMSYTRVIDFLDFRVWPVFNLADTFICIGVGLILLDTLKEFKKG